MPFSYNVHGIDISHYQGVVDWAMLSNTQNDAEFPLRFLFMKATEGGDLTDDTFQQNFQRAKDWGFLRGAYHYFIPTTDARKQAQFFISQVNLQPGDLPPVLDIEVSPKRKMQQQFVQNVKTWLDVVEAYYGVKPILYASYKFKEKYLNVLIGLPIIMLTLCNTKGTGIFGNITTQGQCQASKSKLT